MAIYNLSNYFDDKLHGEFSIFDLKGNLIESGEYKLGFRDGEWSTYEYNKKINTIFYNNGEKIMKNRITELFSVKYPIIQAGMVWCSGGISFSSK